MPVLICVLLRTFLSTLSVRRATINVQPATEKAGEFLSTLSVRRATLAFLRLRQSRCISIHALREESDDIPVLICVLLRVFLSTLSVRRATTYQQGLARKFSHFYPRSP